MTRATILACELSTVLVAPVRSRPNDMPVDLDLVARRAFKISFRYVAHMAGLWGRNGCASLMALSVAGAASAQSLAPPGEIVIHVNSDVRNTEFVEPLVCELAKVVQAPVRARKIDIALTDDLLESGRQFSPRKIVQRFAAATASELELANPFRYLILDHDLTVPQLNYVFAETYRPPLSVISVTRLAPTVEPHVAKRAATETTLPRVYKLMLKSVAVMAGLKGAGCVLSFPRSVAELDAKSSEYCADDRAALVAARVIKETPSATCSNVVASR